MRDPHATIQKIAADLRRFRNQVTDAARLIREYCELDSAERLDELIESAEDVDEVRSEMVDLEDDRNEHKSVVAQITDAIAESLNEGLATEDACYGNALYLLERIVRIIDQSDTDIVAPHVADAAEQARSIIQCLAADAHEVRESHPKSDPTEPERSGRQERNGLALAAPILSITPKGKAIELRYDGKPDKETLAALKAGPHRFRWSPKRKAWMHGYSEEALRFAATLAGVAPDPYIRQHVDIEARIDDPKPKSAADPAPARAKPAVPTPSRVPAGYF